MNFFKGHLQEGCNSEIILLNPKINYKDLPSLDSLVLSSKFQGNTPSSLGVLELLGLAKPAFTKTHLGILHLSLRKGEVVGASLRLRKKQMHQFLEALLLEILPSQETYKLKFEGNSLHLHIYDIFKSDEIGNTMSYLDDAPSLDLVLLAKGRREKGRKGEKTMKTRANLLFFKSLGFKL